MLAGYFYHVEMVGIEPTSRNNPVKQGHKFSGIVLRESG